MHVVNDLLLGFSVALSPANLFYCFVGVILGTLVGVLPGLGPTAGIAILLPVTTGLHPATALIMLAGIYYGAMYGGSTTSILLNVPGETSSVITAIDGYMMARNGRAGPALGICAISSFIAGSISVILLMILGPKLADYALLFGPPEYFAIILLGMSVLISITGKSLVKGMIASILGLMLAMVGIDPMAGMPRFTYGSVRLLSGINFIPVVVGLFAISEILASVEVGLVSVYEGKLNNIFPTWTDIKRSLAGIIRGTFLGFFIGALPGCNPAIATFVSYDIEKKFSKYPEKFGTGVIEGVAGPEGANNSAAEAGLVPLLSLGIPGSPTIAVLMGGFFIHGLTPGPLLFTERPDVIWGLIASLYVGNAVLLVLNLPLVGVWASIAKVPYYILAPIITTIAVVGAFSVNNSLFDVWLALLFGVVGYFMKKLSFPTANVLLAMVLAPLFENALRQALTMSRGSLLIFFNRPISLILIVIALSSIFLSIYNRIKKGSRLDQFFKTTTEED